MSELARLQPSPEDWQRALAIAAHPDDMEYEASSTVARWTSQGIVLPINPADRAGLAAISVEPDLNGMNATENGLFQVRPLVVNIPSGTKDDTNYDINLDLDSVPPGVANTSRWNTVCCQLA